MKYSIEGDACGPPVTGWDAFTDTKEVLTIRYKMAKLENNEVLIGS